eukprot:NODE_147_length_17537_cov_0.265627.p13 type:complete len:157 gc:universal NODE_147_length_17537_cov_0.265627:871-401(-)
MSNSVQKEEVAQISTKRLASVDDEVASKIPKIDVDSTITNAKAAVTSVPKVESTSETVDNTVVESSITAIEQLAEKDQTNENSPDSKVVSTTIDVVEGKVDGKVEIAQVTIESVNLSSTQQAEVGSAENDVTTAVLKAKKPKVEVIIPSPSKVSQE